MPAEPAKANTPSANQAQRPLNGGAEGENHSWTPKLAATNASAASTRTSHRPSSTPVRIRIGFIMPNV